MDGERSRRSFFSPSVQQAPGHSRSERLRAYIDAVRATATAKHGEVQSGSELDRWLRWASEQADRIDPLKESLLSILDEGEKYASAYYMSRVERAPESTSTSRD
jgi:hypothetical protein